MKQKGNKQDGDRPKRTKRPLTGEKSLSHIIVKCECAHNSESIIMVLTTMPVDDNDLPMRHDKTIMS